MRQISLPMVSPNICPAPGFEYFPTFLDTTAATLLMNVLWAELCWEQQNIRLYGRSIPQPRLTSWYGDAGTDYSYSGLHLRPLPWHPELLQLKNQLVGLLSYPFNSVLANAYRDGSDSMGWHSDDEKPLGPRPVIASVSLGANRKFLVRKKTGNTSIRMNLEHGSLLLMCGDSQKTYQHSLPRTRQKVDLRINLTFRRVN